MPLPPCASFTLCLVSAYSAAGIVVCILTTFVATDFSPAKAISEIEHTLKLQLIISTVVMTPVAFVLAISCLPAEFTLQVIGRAGLGRTGAGGVAGAL